MVDYEDAKRDRFRNVAEARVNTVLDKIRLLGQCSNRKNYVYTEDQVRAIFRAIDAEVKATKARFSPGGGGKRAFTLK